MKSVVVIGFPCKNYMDNRCEKSNLERGKALFYSYEEGQARKGRYEVCIYLRHIDKFILHIVDKLYLFSHGWCLTQTQNDAFVCISLVLTLLEDLRK